MFGIGPRSLRAPSGQHWRIGRRWSRRRIPRWRKAQGGGPGDRADGLLSVPDFGAGDDIGTAVVLMLAAVIVVFVAIPLLVFGLELVLLCLAIAAGAFARTLLGRPWVVQARRLDSTDEPLSWHVTGWRRSNQLIDEVCELLKAGLDPSSINP